MYRLELLILFFLLGIFFNPFSVNASTSSDSTKKIKLLFVGDVMGHGPQIKSAELRKNEAYDYTSCFRYISPIIKQVDLAIANLEVTLPGKAPYQGYPRFRSPDDLAFALRTAGFDLLVTANNHANDAGKNGILNTINTLRNLGFYQTGTFRNKKERALFYPLIVYKKGFKLAFLNYTYDTNGLKTVPPTIVNEIDETLIERDLKYTQQFNADAVIVVMHWGNEYHLNENKIQRDLARKMFEWGADIVIGSHPHVVQPIKKIEIEEDGKINDHVVVYSLGNFISNQKQVNTNGGLMFELELEKNEMTGKTIVSQQSYIPIWRYRKKKDKKKTTFYAIPISAFENEETNILDLEPDGLKEMKIFAKKIRKHLNKYHAIERKILLEELSLKQRSR